MALSLYIGNKRYSTWSMRPWIVLKALDIPFEEKLHFFKPGQRQPDFLAFSPTGKVPCLHDGESSTVVWDSLAICEYIAEKYPQVWPSDRAQRAFARCAAAEMHSSFGAIRSECSMNVALRIEMPSISEALQRDLDRFTELFNEGLDKFGGPWIAGKEFSVADAFFAPVASRVKTFGLVIPGKAGEYLDRVFEHPAVQQWIKEGIQEGEREPFHEEDCVRGRKILEDFSGK